MNQGSFFAAVLPTVGFRYAVCFFADSRGPHHRDFAAGDEANLIGYAHWADQQRNAEVYFAVGGYMPDGTGQMSRKAVHALHHRCLRIDLDVGAGDPTKYATQQEAAGALIGFTRTLGLPTPWIIDSGYGIHAYWPFDRDVSLQQWLPMAEALKNAAAAHGLRVDATVTTDAARILRFPGTTNRKRGGAKPVRFLAEGVPASPEQILSRLPAGTTFGITAAQLPSSIAPRAQSELQSNLHPPYFLRGVLTSCPGMQAMLMNGGRRAQEPLWKATLDLVHGAADPLEKREAVAKALSSGHPGYSDGDFAVKWTQTQQQNYQPPTCERMAGLGMPECAACPLRRSVRSPVVLGRVSAAPVPPATAPAPTAALQPAPQLTAVAQPQAQVVGVFCFTAGKSAVSIIDGPLTKDLVISGGMPCERRTKPPQIDGGAPIVWDDPICRYRIVEVERLLDRRGDASLTAITFDCHSDGLRRIEFTHGDLSEPKAFNNKLIAAGLHIPKRNLGILQDKFMSEFLQQLQQLRPANRIADHCGWVDDCSGFVLGTTLHRANNRNESIRPSVGARGEMESYHIAGDEMVWRRAFDIALGGGPDRQVVLALAIAAPLMQFTGVDGLLLNAYTPESGVGKSTLCDAALSIWGAPNKLRKDFRDTANATFKLASIVGNLPMVVDEFTNVEGRALSDYVYTLTQGREKHRLSADAKLNASHARWCLPTITTSNNSVLEKLQLFRQDAVAEAARVFEIRLSPLPMSNEQLRFNKLHLQALREHYGFLGPQLLQIYLKQDAEQWRAMLNARIAYWDQAINATASDRFRSACAALVEIGAAIGKTLGFAFDPVAVRAELAKQWSGAVVEFESNRKTPADIAHDYCLRHGAEFVILGGDRGDSLLSPMPRTYYGEVRGRTVNSRFAAETVMIPVESLRAWCRDTNVSFKALQEWIRDEHKSGGAVLRHGRLTFLQGLMQQVTTNAVEFRASAVLGTTQLTVIGESHAQIA